MNDLRTSGILTAAIFTLAAFSGGCTSQTTGSTEKTTATAAPASAAPAVPMLYSTEFKPGDNAAKFVSPQTEGSQAKIVTADGRSVLQFEGPSGENGFVLLGPPVSGEFAIEVIARSVSDPHDLSIFMDGVGQGPAFQFGADDNALSRLWSDENLNPSGGDEERPMALRIEGKPIIEKGRWYHIRLEVRGGQAVGSVDGQKYGQVKLSSGYDWEKARQPLMYTYGGTIEIQRVTAQQFKPKG